ENSQIEIAADFNQAREKLKSQQFHILITDDEIGPKEKGIELLPLHEKNMPSSRLRTFVMLTSHSTPFVIADFILKGGDVIIGRPFTKDAFIKAIDKALKAKDNIGHDEGLLLDVQDALN